ncbi:hypothetical protein [Azospirillum picis]|uniref:Uncharacterized protein n=1 Tax=Azospirillum picis TaxID=488438 RepID=A0ABU0MPJ2_9PROT|nr:hypothetical protein [Azospirillum picis]MBP2301555.1 hypothetical protein [Azospirillum picis]MDQ0535387.1 hypothetical protein [Azospirillum picis]
MTVMPAPATFAARPPVTVTARTRSGTAWDMVVWAIRDQRSIGEAAGWDDEPCARSTDGVADMLRFDELGCWVDGGQHKGLGRERHADVGPVIAALWTLPEADRLLVIEHARIGCPPERPTVQPQPMPSPADADARRGQAVYPATGQQIVYRLEVAERVAVVTPIREFRGRGRREVVGHKAESVEVLYCPLDYWPSVGMWHHGHAIVERFETAMEVVAAELQRARLTSWEVVGVV